MLMQVAPAAAPEALPAAAAVEAMPAPLQPEVDNGEVRREACSTPWRSYRVPLVQPARPARYFPRRSPPSVRARRGRDSLRVALPFVHVPPQDIVAQVQPKKANWDLQRDVANALDKLERRTQRSLIELARQEDQRRMKESLGEQVGS